MKDAVPDFYNLHTVLHTVPNMHAHVHVLSESHDKHQFNFIAWRGSLAVTLTELKLHIFLSLFHWLKPYTDEGGEEAG